MKINLWSDKMHTEAFSTGDPSEPDHWFRVGMGGTGSQNRLIGLKDIWRFQSLDFSNDVRIVLFGSPSHLKEI